MVIIFICSAIVVLIELLCGKMVLDIFLEKGKNASFRNMIAILIALEIIIFAIASIFQNYVYLKVPIVLIIEVVLWKLYYKDSFLKISLIYLIFTASASLLDYFTLICICKMNSQVFSLLESSDAFAILIKIFGKITNILFILILWKMFKRKTVVQMNKKGWWYTLVFSIFTIVVILMLATNWIVVQNETQANVLLCISIGLVIMNIFMFYVINNILETEAANREKDIFRERLAREIETYHTMEENAAMQRALIHEFRNVLSVITSSEDVKSDAIVELAKEESLKLNEIADSINTENVIVNMVLNTKLKEIRRKKIGILLDVSDLSKLQMEHEDIVIILSNLINNAIEACEQCKDKKMIWIKCFKQGTETLFSVRNTYDVEPMIQNGKYVTTKTINREMHGMGIDNIIRTVEKYHGSYAIKTENKEFLFTITIPES